LAVAASRPATPGSKSTATAPWTWSPAPRTSALARAPACCRWPPRSSACPSGPYSPVSSGSATQATIGPAIQAACAEARRQILEAAAVWLEARAGDLEIRDGTIQVRGAPQKHVTLEQITSQISPHMILGEGVRAANPPDVAIRTFGAQVIEVEVDIATGEVDVLHVYACHDCGRIVNPLLVDSQVIGAVTQGVGYALIEERVVDTRLGHVLNANLEEYHVPTVMDVPRIQHVSLNLPDLAANPTGAKGVGEPPLIPTAPAIANAIYDAIGVRLADAPLLRGRVLDALAQREAAA
jgi:CO/xanthine dehydrogenase Mo-binding subunit